MEHAKDGRLGTAADHVAREIEYLDEGQAAHYLKTNRRRLKELRLRGGGPPFVRLGASVRYRTDWLNSWAEANAVASTSEEAARRRSPSAPSKRLTEVGRISPRHGRLTSLSPRRCL